MEIRAEDDEGIGWLGQVVLNIVDHLFHDATDVFADEGAFTFGTCHFRGIADGDAGAVGSHAVAGVVGDTPFIEQKEARVAGAHMQHQHALGGKFLMLIEQSAGIQVEQAGHLAIVHHLQLHAAGNLQAVHQRVQVAHVQQNIGGQQAHLHRAGQAVFRQQFIVSLGNLHAAVHGVAGDAAAVEHIVRQLHRLGEHIQHACAALILLCHHHGDGICPQENDRFHRRGAAGFLAGALAAAGSGGAGRHNPYSIPTPPAFQARSLFLLHGWGLLQRTKVHFLHFIVLFST